MDLLGIGPIADLFKEILAMFPNAEQRATAASTIQDLAAQIAAAQSATNTAEAANSSIFVAGWRPFCGWACAVAFVYSITLQPLISWAVISMGYPAPPAIDTNTVLGILGGMLGLGTLRTYEKATGIPTTKIGRK